ncbi:hypothetical protein AB837_00302 [bacterium AB1]|nr:hypothetical protein AB837_00302 [bacterium AB1]
MYNLDEYNENIITSINDKIHSIDIVKQKIKHLSKNKFKNFELLIQLKELQIQTTKNQYDQNKLKLKLKIFLLYVFYCTEYIKIKNIEDVNPKNFASIINICTHFFNFFLFQIIKYGHNKIFDCIYLQITELIDIKILIKKLVKHIIINSDIKKIYDLHKSFKYMAKNKSIGKVISVIQIDKNDQEIKNILIQIYEITKKIQIYE